MARVLVAEDEDAVRAFVVRALQHAGHDVQAVEDGQQALERLSGATFDLLVTDIVMPHLDGIALALKVTRDWPAMAIVLMTGFPAERQRAFNLDALIEHVILKPFSLDQFLEQIANALARRTNR